jgi:AraC-like DNA-binding protein
MSTVQGDRVDRIVFSSNEVPSELDEPSRAKLWRDLYCGRFGDADLAFLPDAPFFGRLELVPLDEIVLTRFDGTLSRVARTSRQIATDTRDDFLIGFNCGGPQVVTQRNREVASASGRTIFYTNTEPCCALAKEGAAVVGLAVSRSRVAELVPEANDRICTTFDPTHESVWHLERYIGFLLESSVSSQGATAKHIANTVIDLVALALGASHDAQELAQLRGLRAARLQAIVGVIRQEFSDPGFSVYDVAHRLRLKPRYVQNLLSETGASFSERVIECRLQKARVMLQSREGSSSKISDIAYACGFNEVSYFNRCFRRRFGASPTQFREGAD